MEHAQALVDAVPGAQLIIQEGVAIPQEEWDGLAAAILAHMAG